MKRFINYIIVVALTSLLATSCTKDDSNYSLDDIWLSLGFIETENAFGYDFIILNDNGDTLFPAANDVRYFKTTQKQRVMVNYTILDQVGSSEHKFYVKINSLSEVLYKNIIELSSENADSIGDDPIHVSNIWKADSLLNVEFQYLGGNEFHYINLAINEEAKSKLDEPVNLKFLHNANKDNSTMTLNGIVTFNLNKLKKAGQDSIMFKINYTDYQLEKHDISGTYNY